jgi:hypothetical protein
MTDTTPAAVERFNQFDASSEYARMYEKPDGRWVRYSDYAALSAQLTAANQRAEGLDKALAKARVEGSLKMKADAVNACYDRADKINAIGVMGECCAATANNCADDILSIPADTPAAKVTVQEAAGIVETYLLETQDPLAWEAANEEQEIGDAVIAALRAIAGGHDE